MIRRCLDWLDHRTGYRALAREVLYERIPGGARWRYVWGSTLAFTFLVQVITGFCLWAAYSPGVQNAWASVLYLEEFMTLGALVRSIHHYAAQGMIVLLGLHVLQVIWDGAYRAPREINYWLGWLLALLVVTLALTGYLLPWDQKGYYATQVATKIIGAAPFVGETIQTLVQGGDDYGQQTLTRFFALHAGILPALFVLILAAHLYLFRRHGIHVEYRKDEPAASFWPDQVWKDGMACLLVAAIVLALAWWRPAELYAPADPAETFAAARPEWYFLGLFRWLRFEWIDQMGVAFGAIIVPGIVLLCFLLFPMVAYLPGGHTANRIFTALTVVAVVGLTGLALFEDARDPDHQAALAEARREGERARELARSDQRVPPEGPLRFLRSDPRIRGPRLYAEHCASCHRWNGHDGRGRQIWEIDPQSNERRLALPTAPDLGNLGSREWMRAIVTNFEEHFAPLRNASWFGVDEGIDPSESEMADWSGDRDALLSDENADDLAALIEFLMAERQSETMVVDQDLVPRGRELATEGTWTNSIDVSCSDCHETIGDPFDLNYEGGSGYPDVAGYLSQDWLIDFLRDPGSEQHYGARNQMPAFRDLLTDQELDLLTRWLLEPPTVSDASE